MDYYCSYADFDPVDILVGVNRMTRTNYILFPNMKDYL